MKRPYKIFLDTMAWCLVITDKQISNNRYKFVCSCSSVANAESRANDLTEEFRCGFHKLDVDLSDESMYSLSGDDKRVYCCEL